MQQKPGSWLLGSAHIQGLVQLPTALPRDRICPSNSLLLAHATSYLKLYFSLSPADHFQNKNSLFYWMRHWKLSAISFCLIHTHTLTRSLKITITIIFLTPGFSHLPKAFKLLHLAHDISNCLLSGFQRDFSGVFFVCFWLWVACGRVFLLFFVVWLVFVCVVVAVL